MKRSLSHRFASLVVLCLALALGETQAAESDYLDHPIPHLGAADREGRLIFWREIGVVSLGQQSILPLRLRYSTTANLGFPLFGRNWFCPLLESTLIAESEKKLSWLNLGGRSTTLRLQKDGTFQSGNGQISVRKISQSESSLTVEGWEYKYVSGKLRSVRLASGSEYKWVWQGSRLLGISSADGQMILSLEYTGSQERPTAIVIGKNRNNLVYQRVPVVSDVLGQGAISGYEDSLSEINGTKLMEKYSVELTPAGDYVMELASSRTGTRKYVWKGLDGKTISDGAWTYSVEERPNFVPVVKRKNSEGGVESYYHNSKTGTSVQTLPDGTVITRNYFSARGPTQNKIRNATSTKDGKEISSRQWSYDEKGRLIRDRSGEYERTWSWSEDGRLTEESESMGDKVLMLVRYDETGRPTERTLRDKTYKYTYEAGKKIVQRVQDGKVLSTRVIDNATGAVAFFKPDETNGSLQGAFSKVLSSVSAKDLEQARMLAERSLQILQNEKSQ